MNSQFIVTMRATSALLAERGLQPHGRAQKFLDNEVLRRSMPYIPMHDGSLSKSGKLGTVIGSGEVMYNAPYARYHYYGKVMIGRAPKQLTNKDLKHHGAPRRGAKWFERMKIDHLETLLNGVADVAGGKRR